MATPSTYSSLLGYDPREDELARRKLWAGMYAAAQSPWERIGLGLSQLGGSLFDRATGDGTADPVAQINKLSSEALQQFAPGSSDYYRYIADNTTSSIIKQNALVESQKAMKTEQEQNRKDAEFLQKHPEQLANELAYYTQRLEAKARTLGWNPQEPLSQEVSAEIQAKLEKTPEYKKILQLSTTGQTAIVDKAQKEEKENLNIDLTKLNITKAKQDIADANKSPEAADRLLREVYTLDPEKPIPQQIAANPALSNLQYVPGFVTGLMQTQKKALEKKKTGVIVLK